MTQRPPIPPGLAGALQDGVPVTPRRASTILLVDAAESPWRLLMMRRPGGADFAPGVYVFPGGSQHEEDLGFPDPARAAGVRELFEEMGILLARRRDGRFARDPDCGRLRAALEAGTPWQQALADQGLTLALDRLTFLARWITPERVRRRFDTKFYLARRPVGQTVRPQDGEVDAWLWIAPGAALEPDRVPMIHATRRVLESVVDQPDASKLIARLRRRAETAPVTPRLVPRPEGGFDIVEEPVPVDGASPSDGAGPG